jgi:hypothetical protein
VPTAPELRKKQGMVAVWGEGSCMIQAGHFSSGFYWRRWRGRVAGDNASPLSVVALTPG